MVLCPRCSRPSPDGAPSCPFCHAPLPGAGSTMAMPMTPNPRRPRVSLRVVRADGGPETFFTMSSETLSCGRQADVSLADDPFIAPVQARFFFSGPKLAVEDVGGGNGIFVRLRNEREVPFGSELRVGRQRLLVEALAGIAPAVGNAVVWGSPDPGYRCRLIQLLEGGGRGAAFPLREGDNILGREAGDVAFPTDGFVSGRHALLHVRGDRLTLRDLGSSNGTFVRLGAPAYVESGDQYLMGRELVRVELQ